VFRDKRPEFCPNPDCPYHERRVARSFRWFIRYGSFPTRARGSIQRFLCTWCGKTCSTQTFSLHYWTHLHVDFKTLDDRLNACSGYRQIGRALLVSYSVLKNRVLRLARNYLNLIDTVLVNFRLVEDVAFDGFESFVGSQYVIDNFNIAVGTKTRIPYLFTLSLFRRKGRMTEAQKARRTILDRFWRPERGELVKKCKIAFRDLLSLYLNRRSLTPFTLYTDEKKEYVHALSALTESRHLREIGVLRHRTISSRAARTRSNPLFPVNYIDREIRKNSAAHVRESVRFDREVNMSASRMAIVLGYHTFRKPFTISNRANVDDEPTHADQAGLLESAEARRCFERLYTHRHVWDQQVSKAKWMEDIWQMRITNPPLLTARGKLARCQPGRGWIAGHLLI
jgi:transposase-like protein